MLSRRILRPLCLPFHHTRNLVGVQGFEPCREHRSSAKASISRSCVPTPTPLNFLDAVYVVLSSIFIIPNAMVVICFRSDLYIIFIEVDTKMFSDSFTTSARSLPSALLYSSYVTLLFMSTLFLFWCALSDSN
jgi:hypothetical protein